MAIEFFQYLFGMILGYMNYEFVFLDFKFTLWQLILAECFCGVVGYLSYELWIND